MVEGKRRALQSSYEREKLENKARVKKFADDLEVLRFLLFVALLLAGHLSPAGQEPSHR